MELTNETWFTKLRQKYTSLLFLTTMIVPLALWWLLMLLGFFAGTRFSDANEIGSDLFAMFVIPLILAPIISGLALLVAKLFTIPVVRWLVVFGLGIFFPVGMYLLALFGHWIARKLYLGNKADFPRLPLSSAESNGAQVILVGASTEKKMEQLKEMMDKGLISFKDYEKKKADLLAKM